MTLEQQLEAAHQAITSAVDNLLRAVGTGEAVAAVEALQAAEAHLKALEAEYEAEQGGQQ